MFSKNCGKSKEEEPFYKIFSIEHINEKWTQKILRYSKAHLQELSGRDDDDSVHCIQKNEVRDVHMLVHYQSQPITTEILPEDVKTFRFN